MCIRDRPKGILNLDGIGSVTGGENGAVLDWKKVVGLETVVAVENADLGSLAYLTNSKGRGAMKTTEKSQGTARFLMEGGEVDVYKRQPSHCGDPFLESRGHDL